MKVKREQLKKVAGMGELPAAVRHCHRISAGAKVFFAELTAQWRNTPSNRSCPIEDYAEIYGVAPSTVMKWLEELIKEGFASRTVYSSGRVEYGADPYGALGTLPREPRLYPSKPRLKALPSVREAS